MKEFRILTNRKRAIIALVHSIFFGLLAAYQMAVIYHPASLIEATSGHLAGSVILTTIYFIVSTVLLILVLASRGPMEKLYFAFCATSAGIGLVRIVAGDPTLYVGNFMRVFMLGCAVIVGFAILRIHSASEPEYVR